MNCSRLFVFVCLAGASGLVELQARADGVPASVAEAAKVFDISKIPLAPGAKPVGVRRLAEIFYEADSGVKDAFEFHRKRMLDDKWTETAESSSTAESASATFIKDGYVVSLSVFSTGKPTSVNVSINNHGNVDLTKLPLPDATKPLFTGSSSAMYVTEATPADATRVCREGLIKLGWEPYGEAGETRFYRRNAVRLSATIGAAPGQAGKTAISYGAELMSVELPAPADVEGLQYADTTTTVSFDSKKSADEVFAYYRETLAKTGWKATTDQPIKSGFRRELIFRNPAKDLLLLQIHNFEGKARTQLRHQSAAEVEASEKRYDAQIAERKKAAMKAPANTRPMQAIPIPADATDVKAGRSRIEFKPASGKTIEAVTKIREALVKDGWSERKPDPLKPMAGALNFSKNGESVVVTYVDTGFLPAEISASGFGIDLERAK